MIKVLNSLKIFIQSHKIKNIYIAFSGGSDSLTLLNLVHTIYKKQKLSIYVIHINHQTTEYDDYWSKFCIKQAKFYNFKIFVYTLNPPKNLSNVENWSRNKRYEIFSKILMKTKNNVLLTAHNYEDNIETIIMNIFRGTGILGLRGIPQFRKINNDIIFRPLLQKHKNEIIEYCVKNNLSWIEDPTNFDVSNKRSAIRNKILPLIKEIYCNYNVLQNIKTTSNLCTESNIIINKYLKQSLQSMLLDLYTINLIKLKKFNKLEQKHILYFWFKTHDIKISSKMLAKIKYIYEIYSYHRININKNFNVIIQYKKIHLRKTQHLVHVPKFDIVYKWILKKNIKYLEENFQNKLILRKRRKYDKCKPLYREKTNNLKIIFQEQKIIKEDRLLSWIVCLKFNTNKILAVYPFFVCN